ncbi:MAG TPA: alkaline phosphatase family protein [Burkholderiaceae bacterium]|nr:alkaline phosphatase family protein [Burkholderiaceae bacterium]
MSNRCTRPLPARLASLAAACSAILLQACSTTPRQAPAAPPRLVVFMAVDGLPMRQVLAYRDQLAPDGFRRFLDRGLWFSEAHHGHGYTVTAAGHSVMLSGAYPQRSSIIGNEWVDPQTCEDRYNTDDPAHHYLDHSTAALAGTSPRNYRVETVGDVLRSLHPQARMIGISGKDRGAILPSGHKGTAYLYMHSSGGFTTSDYYLESLPAWVRAFNDARPADRYFGRSWEPLLKDAHAYDRSVPDGQPWQSSGGNGNRLPAVVGAGMSAPGPAFWSNLLTSPFADELTLDFARAAIAGEHLGEDDIPDLLSISLSSHDYVNHAFGPESRLSHDHVLHLDRYLQDFFRTLDERVGRERYMVVLTADHGFLDTPEWARSQGRDAGRVPLKDLMAAVNDGLVRQFGEGPWVTHWSATGMLFDEARIQSRGLDRDAVYALAARCAEQVPGIAAAFTRAQLSSSYPAPELLQRMRLSWHPDTAAPLQIVVRPGWMISSKNTGTTHGSPHRYDTHVPILAWGPAWWGRGEVGTPVAVADIAPTLARMLDIPPPQQVQGQVLPVPTMRP